MSTDLMNILNPTTQQDAIDKIKMIAPDLPCYFGAGECAQHAHIDVYLAWARQYNVNVYMTDDAARTSTPTYIATVTWGNGKE